MAAETEAPRTEVGSYFVSNYPPFSQWKPEFAPAAFEALEAAPRRGERMGLYLHIPFCRKRCEFCYFKVYTDKNAQEIERYLAALDLEMGMYSRMSALQGRQLRFMYFGGGTPSYLSEKQLHSLVERLDRHVSWQNAEEVTFECEPGTLRQSKLETLKEIGITRLSLGVENFNDEVLKANGRAHLSAEIFRAYDWAREVGFDQVNIDLIAGMVGETEENWQRCIRQALELQPDSLTVYQMELPYNTVISRRILDEGQASPIPDWATKRRWVSDAMDLFEAAGYRVASATTIATTKKPCQFVYTDGLWKGTDMIALGVSSFGYFGGVHMQNAHSFNEYLDLVESGKLPIVRAYPMKDGQRLIREMILQLKTGRIERRYFIDKFGTDVAEHWGGIYRRLEAEGMLHLDEGAIVLTRKGLLQVDGFLKEFFEPEFRNVRYT